ncbi:NAD(P)-binding protein [Canariomyces notabilis]|uniref:NAD(P)-binding protein n=1 Tax=Canariomyces notabilis TaxID=2074819 RepID=A0AAN6TMG8_9PEZI|nr:NAD(P)-binding protein [Canariomyces arenarius]
MFWGPKSVSFNPAKDIPPLTDKVILVTGANVGLGKQAVLEFARHHPRLIWLGARSVQKGNAAADEIRRQVPGAPIRVLDIDLASFASVKKAAATVISNSSRLDILMLNAGIMATAPGLTANGYELQFGTNHMGHALLFKLLLPLLNKTATGSEDGGNPDKITDVRVVSLTSKAHNLPAKGGINFDSLKTPGEMLGTTARYGQSKLANLLWARQLARAHPQLTAVSVHPGMVQTELWDKTTGAWSILQPALRGFKKLLPTIEEGAKNQLWASVSPDVRSGEYYEPVGIPDLASALGKDDELARRLWEWTERELEEHVL